MGRHLVDRPGRKRCPACTRVKAKTKFYAMGPGRTRARCIACDKRINAKWKKSEAGIAWAATYVARKRRWHAEYKLRKIYGISPEDWAQMYEAQNGCCAGCSDPLRASDARVDHHHGSGAVRGLLCPGCNSALGHAQDNPKVLRMLAEYLEASGLYSDDVGGLDSGPNDLI
jgi:hypothetical protein